MIVRLGIPLLVFLAGFVIYETAQTRERGRAPAAIMSADEANWLEREGRAAEEKPELLIEAMALKPGQVVADIGVGTGFHARRMAMQVGTEGLIYGVDIQPEMLDRLMKECAAEGIENVVPILGSGSDTNLPDGSLDWVLLVDTYHEFQRPEAMLDSIRADLKPSGRVCLVEYRSEGNSALHIHEDHRMSEDQMLREWEAAGFVLLEQVEHLPTQHLMIFGLPN